MAVKGQNIRLYLEEDQMLIAGATSLTLNINVEMADSSTKDSDSAWIEREPVGLSWDCSTDALVFDEDPTGGTDGSLLSDWFSGVADVIGDGSSNNQMVLQIVKTSGSHNRTVGTAIASGSVCLSSITVNAQNRQNATWSVSFQGQSALS